MIFGRVPAGTIPPPHHWPGASAPRLLIEEVREPLAHGLGPPALSVPMLHPEGHGRYEVWCDGARLVLRVTPIGEFECTHDAIRVYRLMDVSLAALQWQVYGLVISAWSEWAGYPVLHAAVADIGGVALGLFGDSGAGKSSTALALLQAGHRTLGDDQMVVLQAPAGPMVCPAVPWFKLDERMARRVADNPAMLPRIHPAAAKRRYDVSKASWAEGPVPLRAGYVLSRGTSATIAFEPVPPVDSLLALLRYTYVPRTVAAAGLAARRFRVLAEVARRVPIFTLHYPDGEDHLDSLSRAVALHTRTLASV